MTISNPLLTNDVPHYAPANTYYRALKRTPAQARLVGLDPIDRPKAVADRINYDQVSEQIGYLKTLRQLLATYQIIDPIKLTKQLDHDYANDEFYITSCNDISRPVHQRALNVSERLALLLDTWIPMIEAQRKGGIQAIEAHWDHCLN